MALNRKITDWRGKRLWLIGASSGIGLSLARSLLQQGADVTVSARNAVALQALVRDFPEQCLALPLDASHDEDMLVAYQSIRRWRDQLDYLVFCAADYQPMRAWTLDATRASQMIDTNIKAPIYAVHAVLPDMLARGSGGIAIIASVAGYVGLPQALAYGPTKAALINFCESLYLDLHDRGIAVHVINPGFVETPLTAGNTFKMPALITADEAAHEILAGIAAGEFEIHFPRRFTNSLKLLRHLPYPLQFKALRRVAEQS